MKTAAKTETLKKEIYNPELEVVHKVRIESAKVVRSMFGDSQLQLWLSFLDDAGNEKGRRTVWESLMNQESDLQLPAEKAIMRNEMRANMLKSILASKFPEGFTTFAKKKGKKFLDFDGTELTPATMATKKLQIAKDVSLYSSKLKEQCDSEHNEVAELRGVTLFAVFKPNPKNEKYPYLSLNHQKHQSYEMVGA